MIDYRAAIQPGHVDGCLYVDADVFAEEMTRIFTRGWVFVGHESELAEPGDWVTRRVGREPVIFVRDRGGDLHVLANRCSHRGTTLCSAARGSSRSFVCTYTAGRSRSPAMGAKPRSAIHRRIRDRHCSTYDLRTMVSPPWAAVP